jgi:hypothetical protein
MTDLEMYRKATKMMGHPKLSDLMSEVGEFWEEPSWEEAVDVLHSLLRFLSTPDVVVFYLARKTAMKHVARVREYGCPRSKRNHNLLGDNCPCKKG